MIIWLLFCLTMWLLLARRECHDRGAFIALKLKGLAEHWPFARDFKFDPSQRQRPKADISLTDVIHAVQYRWLATR